MRKKTHAPKGAPANCAQPEVGNDEILYWCRLLDLARESHDALKRKAVLALQSHQNGQSDEPIHNHFIDQATTPQQAEVER